FNDLVAARSVFRRRRHTLLAKAQLLAALCARRNPQLRPSVDSWDIDLGAQRGFPRGHWDGHVDIVALAMKHRMLTGANDDIEIAWRAAVRPGIALAGETYALAVARPGLHRDLERLRALTQAFAMTRGAHALRLPRAAAARARGVEFHPAAGLRDLTFTAALGTGCRRADHAFAPAIAAGIQTGDV